MHASKIFTKIKSVVNSSIKRFTNYFYAWIYVLRNFCKIAHTCVLLAVN